MSTIGYVPGVPDAPADWSQVWGARAQTILNAVVSKINNAADLTLTASAATTTMTDARLSAQSILTFMPTTAHAAAVLTSIYVTGLKKGQGTINHANDANTDKVFRVAIHG